MRHPVPKSSEVTVNLSTPQTSEISLAVVSCVLLTSLLEVCVSE